MTDSIEENPVYAKRCISKVHDELGKAKPKCYKPMIVSIGPYYHKCDPSTKKQEPSTKKQEPRDDSKVVIETGAFNDPDLKEMQQFKELYLISLLERRNRSLQRRNKRLESRENYFSELAKLETKARKCYEDPMSTINDKEFTEMLLLDSCFIVEFIRKMNYVPSDENDPTPNDEKAAFYKDDPIGTVQWKLNQIQRDMILLENQLPYFVLSKFYDLTKYDGEKSLEEMAMSCFNASLPRPRLKFSNSKGKESLEEMPMSCFNASFQTPGLYFSNRASKGEKISHLLHLVHIFCRPSVPKDKKRSSDESTSAQRHDSSAKEVGKSRNSNDYSDQNRPLLKKSPEDSVGSSNENNPTNNPGSVKRKIYVLKNHIGTVVELQEAGVNFEKVGEVNSGLFKEGKWNDYVSLFDIEFKCGVMKVPCFKVEASTETLLRNLIAYEQQYFIDDVDSENFIPKYFTDFAILMNQLINSKKDTNVLRYQDIIINFLRDDEDVSRLFNTLTNGVCDSLESYFLEVRENVDKHCKTKWKIWLAKLRLGYFKNPWAGVSTVAAIVLLLLTVGQFVIALLTLLA